MAPPSGGACLKTQCCFLISKNRIFKMSLKWTTSVPVTELDFRDLQKVLLTEEEPRKVFFFCFAFFAVVEIHMFCCTSVGLVWLFFSLTQEIIF